MKTALVYSHYLDQIKCGSTSHLFSFSPLSPYFNFSGVKSGICGLSVLVDLLSILLAWPKSLAASHLSHIITIPPQSVWCNWYIHPSFILSDILALICFRNHEKTFCLFGTVAKTSTHYHANWEHISSMLGLNNVLKSLTIQTKLFFEFHVSRHHNCKNRILCTRLQCIRTVRFESLYFAPLKPLLTPAVF